MKSMNFSVNLKIIFIGGLLIALKPEDATNFIQEIQEIEDYPAWIVGVVEKGERTAVISPDVKIIEVPMIEGIGRLW